jgi:hyaluronate lyase
MNKRSKMRLFTLLLATCLNVLLIVMFDATPIKIVKAEEPAPTLNLTLYKPVTYSGVEGGKVNGGWKYPQFVGEKVVDGDEKTRWSADKVYKQWLVVDLGQQQPCSLNGG